MYPPVQNSFDMDKIVKRMEEEGEKTRSLFESFNADMIERDFENKRHIEVLKEQREKNEREISEMEVTIKSLEEKFTVQYIQYKAESNEAKV